MTVTNTSTNVTAYSSKPFVVTFSTSQTVIASSFSTKVDFTAGLAPWSVAVGDIDGDGKPDLAVVNGNGTTVSVYRNTATSGSITSSSLASKVDFTVGTSPTGVAFGDIDGDGKLDLMTANSSSKTVSVFRNLSTSGSITSSSFASKVDLNVDADAVEVVVRDFDGDGKPDIAVTVAGTNKVSVFPNLSTSGSITSSSFGTKTDLTTGTTPTGIAAEDLDGDSKPDIVVTNFDNGGNGTTISILRNTSTSGAISFATKVDFTTGSGPDNVAIGDIDNDGKPDIAVINATAVTFSVLRNLSTSGTITTSSFASKVDFTIGTGPFSIALADLDGDGRPDVVATNGISASVSILRNAGVTGSITSSSLSSKVDFTTGGSPYGLAIGDIDGDGKPDLITANAGSGTISVLRNAMTAGTGSAPTVTTSAATGISSSSATLNGSVNPNGSSTTAYFEWGTSSTLATSSATSSQSIGSGSSSVSVTANLSGLSASTTYYYRVVGQNSVGTQRGSILNFTTTATTGVSFASKVDFTTGNAPAQVAIGDLDGDGKPDVAVVNENATSMSIFRNISPSGGLSLDTKVDFTTGSTPTDIIIGDLDGDGKSDVVVTNWNSGTISVFRNTGASGLIAFAAKVDFTTGNSPNKIVIGDMDGDGKLDLAITNSNGNSVSIFRNTSTSGTISLAARVDLATGGFPIGIAVGDLDGDGKPDLLVANNNSGISVIRNTSASGAVSFASRVDLTAGLSPIDVALADADGDGKLDLIVANRDENNVSVFRNTSTSGSLSFATKVDFSTGSSPYYLVVGDLDADGKTDIVVTISSSNIVSVFRNISTSGTASYASKVDFGTGILPSGVALGDLDGDGKPDLIVANNGGGTLSVLRNTAGASTGTTPTVASTASTNVTSTSATLNGTVNPNSSSTTAYFEWGTSSTLATSTATTSQSIGSGTSSVSVTANLSGLTASTTYYFRVVGLNSAGTQRASILSFTTTAGGTAPTVSTDAPTNITTTSAILKGTINPNGLSTTVTLQYGTTTGYGSTVTATQSPVSGSGSTSVSASLSGLSAGTTYHYRVAATNTAGTANGLDQTFITYSTTYTATSTVSFPARSKASDYTASDYRLVGLPGASGTSVGSILSGSQNVDWQVYWDNGASSNFLVSYDGSANFSFTVGKAFWIISKTSVNINRSVTAATLNANQEAEIPLQSGWNLITNPFMSSIAWSRIQTTNGTSGSLWGFNNSFSSSTSFDPYVGYYYFNGAPNPVSTVLRVPYASIFGKVAEVGEDSPGSWKVNVVLKSGESVDRESWFGVDGEAKQGMDPKDLRKPRGVGAISEAYFDRPEWDVQYPVFATDIRSSVNGIERWEFTLNTPELHPSSLTLSGVNAIPSYFSVYLIDESRAKYIDVRRDSVYEFVPAVSRLRFSVLVGRKDEVTQKLQEVEPKEFELGQNFPNPFNPSTTIPVSVPFVSEARLDVYNILGQNVRTLHTGLLEPGRYWFQWDGKDERGISAPSGVYVYRLSISRTGSFGGKMILTK
jgi:phosphodiesterase/alkaline phosphatase D-like protein